MKANKLKRLSRRDKVLLRPNRYIGSIQPYEHQTFLFTGEKFEKKDVTFVPGLLKVIREVIDNSIDEGIRTSFKFANKIDIEVNKNGWITVTDNGRGIPIELIEDDSDNETYMPEGAWAELDVGSNFDDEDDNTTLGQNGEGVALTNIFSKEFVGITCDGKKSFQLNSYNNMEKIETTLGKSTKKYTKVSFLPDYNRFGVDGLDNNHEMILMSDLINLSLTFPNIVFSYNGKQLKARNFKDYIKLFGNENVEILEEKNLNIAIMNNPEDNFGFVHYINGLNVYNGGKPLDWVVRGITGAISDKLIKKFPNLKVGDIKNKLFVVAIIQNMVNPRFEDQIKSICSNTLAEFKPQLGEPDWGKFAQRLIKNDSIIKPITEVYLIREELSKKKELDGLEKVTKKKITSEKYLPATGIRKYLMITEGESATGGLMPVLGRKEFGYYELKGKPLNAIGASHSDFMKNTELKDLYEIIKTEKYDFIVFSTDADLDGIHIRALGLAFTYKYTPEHLKTGKICMLQTPMIGVKKANKLIDWCYRFDEATPEFQAKGSVKYYKGLGSWKENDLKMVIEKDGISKMIVPFEYDDLAEKTILGWLHPDNAEFRKEKISDNSFSLFKL